MKPFDEKPLFRAVIVMGVSGCGKTTIASLLAEELGWTFIESDNYHSEEQILKMSNGIPLTDADRQPWLETLHGLLADLSNKNQPAVLACSALKEKYRRTLTAGLKNFRFVYLKGEYGLIWQRMQERQHYMKPTMLRSQFEALEEPENALVIDITLPPEKIVSEILQQI